MPFPLDEHGKLVEGQRLQLEDALDWDKRLSRPQTHARVPQGSSGKPGGVLNSFINKLQTGPAVSVLKTVQDASWTVDPGALQPTHTGRSQKPNRLWEAVRVTDPKGRGGSLIFGFDVESAPPPPSDLWRFNLDDLPRFSIPLEKTNLFDLNGNVVLRASAAGRSLGDYGPLKVRWIFTPTHNRFWPGSQQAYLDRSKAMGLEADQYVEVLVVAKHNSRATAATTRGPMSSWPCPTPSMSVTAVATVKRRSRCRVGWGMLAACPRSSHGPWGWMPSGCWTIP